MSESVELILDVEEESELSLLLNDGTTRAWVPKKEVQQIESTKFVIPEWLAIDRGWI